ncbi:hypothetical protein AAFN85_20610 [Mucilaginibacter sp. CAU 1740]|uniref:hypothetical protein n=1 Tax=Mucilaginibacter sp. CAU 1740 TaxID=3140365 RepID=UPI00325B82BD
MKKFIPLFVAFFASVTMLVAAAFFIRLNTGLIQPANPTGFFMIALQVVCALKFTLIIIMLMPHKPVLKQVGLGFVLSDAVIIFSGMASGYLLTIQLPLFIVQTVLMVYYMAGQGYLWIYKSAATAENTNKNNELVTSGI